VSCLLDQVPASAARVAEASQHPMHGKRLMSFEYFESKNQLGKFPVAAPRRGQSAMDPPSREFAAPATALSPGDVAGLWSIVPLYTLTGRQNPAFTAEVDRTKVVREARFRGSRPHLDCMRGATAEAVLWKRRRAAIGPRVRLRRAAPA